MPRAPRVYFCIPHSPTRQTCAVYLKNRIQKSYSLETPPSRPDQVPIPASDREILKSSILRLLAASPSRGITLQLASALKAIVANDFPDKWPRLLDDVKILLNSGDIREVGAGCVVALECVRAFRQVKVSYQLYPSMTRKS
jgi:hypothetical protein